MSASSRDRLSRPRIGLVVLLLLLGLGSSVIAEAKGKNKQKREDEAAVVAALPEKYRQFLAEVDVLLSDDERSAFLAIEDDYRRDAFIERFWRSRDPYPDTARNEFRDRFQETLREVKVTFEDPREERARFFLLNGAPADRRVVRCPTILWPIEIWFYPGSARVRYDFFAVFYKRWGAGKFTLWRPADGLDVLFQQVGGAFQGSGNLLSTIRNQCYEGDEVAAVFGHLMAQGPFEYDSVLEKALEEPEAPHGEWVSTFAASSTEIPDGATALEASLDVLYPGRRQSRTVTQAVVSVPVAKATIGELGDYRSYNFVLTGEVLSGDQLFESFRYKFDFPAGEVAAKPNLAMVFERQLRPGDYRMVIKLEDQNGRKFYREERALAVPVLENNAPPPPPANPETAQLVAEANRFLSNGDVTLRLLPLNGELLSGYRRIDTLVGGSGVARVVFRLDDREVLSKKAPPWSVELDLGHLPRPRTLTAEAFDAAGNWLASDEVLLNASTHRFAAQIVEPRPGSRHKGSVTVRADIETPEGQALERVEFFLNESKVATLYQPPYEQLIPLPATEELGYVQVQAFLADGNTTQDLVFINAPGELDEVDIQFVELYATAVDRDGRPVLGLSEKDFSIREDEVPQEIRRFEQVGDLPIHTAVLLDVSASMEDRLSQAREAAVSFLRQLVQPKDRAAVFTFNDRAELVVKFTSDTTALAAGLAGVKAERGTALYDSVIYSLFYFNGIKGQRALLLLSDGKDEASRFAFEDAVEYARRAGVTIYAIGLDLPKGDPRRKLSELAQETGGRSFFVADPSELPAVYAAIEHELRSQYLIAYQSTNTKDDGKFRTIEVEIAKPGHEAKTMRGYYP